MWQWLQALLQRPQQPEPEDDTSTYPDDPPDGLNCPDTQPTQPGALEP